MSKMKNNCRALSTVRSVKGVFLMALVTVSAFAGTSYQYHCGRCGQSWRSLDPAENYCRRPSCTGSAIRRDIENEAIVRNTKWKARREIQQMGHDRGRQMQQEMTMFNQHLANTGLLAMQQLQAIEQRHGREAALAFAQQKCVELEQNRQAILAQAPAMTESQYRMRENFTQQDFHSWFRSGNPDELQRLKAELAHPFGTYHSRWNPQKYQMMCQRYQELTGQRPCGPGVSQPTVAQSMTGGVALQPMQFGQGEAINLSQVLDGLQRLVNNLQ